MGSGRDMIPRSQLLGYGARLSTPFRSLGPSTLNKNQRQARPMEPKLPELSDLTDDIYPNQELAALARYYNLGRGV